MTRSTIRAAFEVHITQASMAGLRNQKAYGRGIDQKPEQVVLNKKDMVDSTELEKKRNVLSQEVGHDVICISAMKKQGIQYLFPWMRQWCMTDRSQS